MNIFQFLFYLGIINIIFGFVWKWVFALPAAFLFALLNFDYGMRAVKIFGSYLLVSLTALLTLAALGENPSGLALIFYPLIGAFVLFMAYASNQYEARKEASATMDWQMIQRLERDAGFETILTFGVIILFVITLFVPSIATNGLNEWLFSVIDWIFNLPIIGWLIGIGGVFFLLNIIFHGIFATGFVIASLVGKFRKAPTTQITAEQTNSDDKQ